MAPSRAVPASYDQLWQRLIQRQGKQPGTRQMIELLQLASQQGWQRFEAAVATALELECWDAAAVRYLMTNSSEPGRPTEFIEVGALSRYERPLPEMTHFDQLLEVSA